MSLLQEITKDFHSHFSKHHHGRVQYVDDSNGPGILSPASHTPLPARTLLHNSDICHDLQPEVSHPVSRTDPDTHAGPEASRAADAQMQHLAQFPELDKLDVFLAGQFPVHVQCPDIQQRCSNFQPRTLHYQQRHISAGAHQPRTFLDASLQSEARQPGNKLDTAPVQSRIIYAQFYIF